MHRRVSPALLSADEYLDQDVRRKRACLTFPIGYFFDAINFLIYKLAKEMYGEEVGLLSATLYPPHHIGMVGTPLAAAGGVGAPPSAGVDKGQDLWNNYFHALPVY